MHKTAIVNYHFHPDSFNIVNSKSIDSAQKNRKENTTMKERLIALQVYSVRDAAEADFAGTMRQVKEMGYDGVELAGTYGMTAVEAKNPG